MIFKQPVNELESMILQLGAKATELCPLKRFLKLFKVQFWILME
jgi:hypothetical protein